MKVGDIVRFKPSVGYVDDWLRSKLGPAPEAVGIIANTPPFTVGYKPFPMAARWKSDAWTRVVFPPDTREWDVPSEELEVLSDDQEG